MVRANNAGERLRAGKQIKEAQCLYLFEVMVMTGWLNANINSVFYGTNQYFERYCRPVEIHNIAVITCNILCFEFYSKCLHANKVLAQHLLAAPQG